jgi:hypothetical protein
VVSGGIYIAMARIKVAKPIKPSAAENKTGAVFEAAGVGFALGID